MSRPFWLLTVLVTAGVAAGCGASARKRSTAPTAPVSPPPVHLVGSLRLSSSAFTANGPIPRTYTCDGQDLSLPGQWSGVPAGTRELVLVMRDPDAPGGNFVHWALAGIAPTRSGFTAGGVSGTVVPGRNSFGSLGYRGPCPPRGKPHHYVLTLSALPTPSGLKAGFNADQLRTSEIAIATLIGTYSRG